MSTQELPAYTEQEVASHNTPESLWITIDDKVYDVTAFQDSVNSRVFVVLLALYFLLQFSTLVAKKCC